MIRLLVTAIALHSIVAVPLTGQTALGAYGAAALTDLSGDGPPATRYLGRTGYVIGVQGDLFLAADLAISLQPSYAERGARIGYVMPGEEELRDSLDLRLSYVSIPVLLKIIAGHERTFFTGGIDLSFLVDANVEGGDDQEDVSESLSALDVLAVFGFGVAVRKSAPTISLELRYVQSITNVASNQADPDVRPLPVRFRSTGLQLLAAVMLRIGG